MSHIFFKIVATITCAGNNDHFSASDTIDRSSNMAQNDLTFVEHCESNLLRLEFHKDCLYKELKVSYTAHEINILYYAVKKLIALPKCVKSIGKSIVKNKIDEIWGYQKQIFDEMHAMSKIYDILRPKDITLTRGYTEWCMFGVEHLLTDDTERYQSSSNSNLTREYEIDQIIILYTMYKLRHENACKTCGKEVSEETKTKLVVIDLYINNRELFEKNTATVRDLLKRYDEFDDCNNGKWWK